MNYSIDKGVLKGSQATASQSLQDSQLHADRIYALNALLLSTNWGGASADAYSAASDLLDNGLTEGRKSGGAIHSVLRKFLVLAGFAKNKADSLASLLHGVMDTLPENFLAGQTSQTQTSDLVKLNSDSMSDAHTACESLAKAYEELGEHRFKIANYCLYTIRDDYDLRTSNEGLQSKVDDVSKQFSAFDAALSDYESFISAMEQIVGNDLNNGEEVDENPTEESVTESCSESPAAAAELSEKGSISRSNF